MQKNIYVFLAEGFEEIEAVTTIDLLRRAGLPTHVVAVGDSSIVQGANGIAIQADLALSEVYPDDVYALILPGGMPGVTNLAASEGLRELILSAHAAGRPLGAICAAPSVYGWLGLLKGQEAISYPGFEKNLEGATISEKPVVKSGQFITGKSVGYAIDFALALITEFAGAEKAEEVAAGIIYKR